MISTNNSFMDNIINQIKILSYNSVLKNEELSINSETKESIKNGDLYVACNENTTSVNSFATIPVDILLSAGVSADKVYEYSLSPNKIPKSYHNILLPKMNKYIIDNYIETNDYYRMLNGLPNTNDADLYIDYDIESVDTKNPISKMSNIEIDILRKKGVIENLILDNPDKKYLKFLGTHKISIYKARRAKRFELISCPTKDIDSNIYSKFISTFEKNRIYTLKTVYSGAFKDESDYYDEFICIFIITQTIVDMLINTPEYIIKRDFFDIISIRDMFISHGIEFFPEIPMRYQISMMKNLNKLLKFKSTNRNLIDICSIFGFNDIKLFKYYILKNRKTDYYDNYTMPVYDENNKEIDEVTYDLKFIKVPIDGIADDYIRDNMNHLNYNDIVRADKYWYGNPQKTKQEVDADIINHNFNYMCSKYLSIDTIYDMNKLSFDISYFFNMIFKNKELEEQLTVPVYKLGPNNFKLVDIICLLYVLTYERIGIEDTILDTSSNILTVMGFNFEANMSQLSTYLYNNHLTLDDVGIADFIIPKDDILSYNDLIRIYINNKNIHDHLVKQMHEAEDIHIYRIYKKIYDSLMISKLNTSNFTKKDGSFANTYTDYIKDRDEVLYSIITNIRELEGSDKNIKLTEYIDEIVISLEEYINVEGFEFSFSNISTISNDLLKGYLYKIINFFKSYTVQLLSINNIYTFNDRYLNKVLIIDNLSYNATHEKISTFNYNVIDYINIVNKSLIKNSDMRIKDEIFINRTYE